MAKLVDATGKVLFEGYEHDMKEAFMYLTMSSVEMAERGYGMADLRRFNEKYYQTIKGNYVEPIRLITDMTNEELRIENDNLKKEVERYKKGYGYLMEYWDSISEEQKPELDRLLQEIGL